MPKIYDITDWNELTWVSTGGTRAKMFLQDATGKYWFFKQSQKKPATADKLGKDFKFEFWNEIIAYNLDEMLGFNMLQYDVAFKNGIIGCISPSMINNDIEELIEGVKYLQGSLPSYNPLIKADQFLYDFQNIELALDHFEVGKYKNHIIELIVFDSLIGNGDRHQENWALINSFSEVVGEITKDNRFRKKLMRKISGWNAKKLNNSLEAVKLYLSNCKGFAPIYDSGSSLGRELTEENVGKLVNNESQLSQYLEKGKAEILGGEKSHSFSIYRKFIEVFPF